MITLVALWVGAQLSSSLFGPVPQAYVPKKVEPSEVVATVDGAPIKASDVEDYLWDAYGASLTEDFIALQAVKTKADKMGLKVTPEEVVVALRDSLTKAEAGKKANQQDPDPSQSAQQQLASTGFPLSRLYLRTELGVYLKKIALANFQPAQWVKVSTIIFRSPSSTAQAVADAAKRAQAAFQRLKKGDSWEVVMQSTGATPAQVHQGGVLGWRPIVAFPEGARSAISQQKSGSYTEPIQTQYGFQIFRIDVQGISAGGKDLQELSDLYCASQEATILQSIKKSAVIVRHVGDGTAP